MANWLKMADVQAIHALRRRQAHPEAIREYRVAERRDRAARKQYRRAARRRNLRARTR